MDAQGKQNETRKTAQGYGVNAYAPGDLTDVELATCVKIIRDGGAVTISLEKLQNARMLAVARNGSVIVGVGSIKRDQPQRAAEIAKNSGFDFPNQTPELGYVAVAPQHRRKGISHQLVGALVKAMPGSFFTTTDDENMMRTLSGAGFTRRGNEWIGT